MTDKQGVIRGSINRLELKKKTLVNLMHLINDELLKKLWIEDRISYLALATINHGFGRGVTTDDGRDHQSHMIGLIREYMYEAWGCDDVHQNRPPTGFCGTHEEYVQMFNTVWEAPFTMSFRTHEQLLYCGMPANIVGLSLRPTDRPWAPDAPQTRPDENCSRDAVKGGHDCDHGVPSGEHALYGPNGIVHWQKNMYDDMFEYIHDPNFGSAQAGTNHNDEPLTFRDRHLNAAEFFTCFCRNKNERADAVTRALQPRKRNNSVKNKSMRGLGRK